MFELHITSSKDIKTLNIEFEDGTSINGKVKKDETKGPNTPLPKKFKKGEDKNDEFFTSNSSNSSNSSNLTNPINLDQNIKSKFKEDIINTKKTFNIDDIVDIENRPAKIAEELDNLDL